MATTFLSANYVGQTEWSVFVSCRKSLKTVTFSKCHQYYWSGATNSLLFGDHTYRGYNAINLDGHFFCPRLCENKFLGV